MHERLHYIPILKSKKAELTALNELTDDVKQYITPLIEVIPVPWDFKNDKPKKTQQEHLKNFTKSLAKNWTTGRPIFIDFYYVATGEKIESKHPILYSMEYIRKSGTKVIPTTGLERDASFQDAVAQAISDNNNGVCLRIQKDDIDNSNEMNKSLDALLKQFDVSPDYCDLIIDFESLPIKNVVEPIKYIYDIIIKFPYIKEWRTLTVAASAFPEFLTDIQPDSKKMLPRNEFLLWKSIISANRLPRLPYFGDYAIQHPNMTDTDFRNKKIPVNLRYTVSDHWLVYKGRDKNRYGHDQFNKICHDLANGKEYSGPTFSAGDAYIDRCSKYIDGPGVPWIWRRTGFSHHIAFVVKQIANTALP